MTDIYRDEALARLKALLKPGTTVYTSLRSVSSNGMSRHIEVLVVSAGRIRNITRDVGRVTDTRVSDKTGALVVGGTGMDMGFAVVYDLSRTLYPKAWKCSGSDGYIERPAESNGYRGKSSKTPRCQSNDHSNGMPYEKGAQHSDGGYALKHEWV